MRAVLPSGSAVCYESPHWRGTETWPFCRYTTGRIPAAGLATGGSGNCPFCKYLVGIRCAAGFTIVTGKLRANHGLVSFLICSSAASGLMQWLVFVMAGAKADCRRKCEAQGSSRSVGIISDGAGNQKLDRPSTTNNADDCNCADSFVSAAVQNSNSLASHDSALGTSDYQQRTGELKRRSSPAAAAVPPCCPAEAARTWSPVKSQKGMQRFCND
jgi:hypothetical protein